MKLFSLSPLKFQSDHHQRELSVHFFSVLFLPFFSSGNHHSLEIIFIVSCKFICIIFVVNKLIKLSSIFHFIIHFIYRNCLKIFYFVPKVIISHFFNNTVVFHRRVSLYFNTLYFNSFLMQLWGFKLMAIVNNIILAIVNSTAMHMNYMNPSDFCC